MKRSNRPIPVYIVDEHNEAFYYWQKAKYDGLIREPLDLFHMDAHDDMGRPESFRESVYPPRESPDGHLEYYQDFAKKELHNGNFIIPAVLGGLVKNVYFIYPGWRKFKPKRKRFNVSSVFGEGKILKYGMKAADHMEEKLNKALPDLKYYNFRMIDIDRMPQKRKVILDIDLDYFACRDSILNHYCYDLEITEEQFHKREDFLSDRTIAFAGLSFNFLEKDNKYFVQVAHKKGKDVSHLPSKDEISAEINALMNTLHLRKIRPMVVTIARSCISGYCPGDYVGTVETELNHQLKRFLET